MYEGQKYSIISYLSSMYWKNKRQIAKYYSELAIFFDIDVSIIILELI